MEALVDATIAQINSLHSTEDVLRAVVEGDETFRGNPRDHSLYFSVRKLFPTLFLVSGVEVFS
jgi:hypothetical protein